MLVAHKNGIEDESENIFSKLLFTYLPYWRLFVVLLLLCVAGAVVYLHYATPIYNTSAAILVKDEKKGLDDTNLMEQLDLFGSKKLVENEIEVIQSRMLMRQVVKNLSLYAPVIYKGRVKSKSAYVFSPVTIQVRNPDSLIEQEKVYFTYDSAQKLVVINGKDFPLYQWTKSDSLGEIRFLPNPNYQAPAIKKPLYFNLVSVKEVADKILDILKISQATKLSSVIDLRLKDAVPKRAEDILNGLIAVYDRAAIDDKNALASNTLKFIRERLKLVTGELDSVEAGIQRYKSSNGIIDVTAQGQLYLDNVGANDAKLSEINVQLAVMDQVERYVQSKDDQSSIIPSTFGVDNKDLSALLEKFYDLQVQYEGLRKTTADNNPLLLTLRTQIEKIRPNILESVKNTRRNLEAGKANLTSTSDKYASILKDLPEKEKGLVKISRQQAVQNGIYSFLLQKREETALSYNSTVADTRIVDDATTTVLPVSPIPALIYLIAGIAAFSLGAGFLAIREIFNRNIMFRKEIEQYTSVPIVAEIKLEDSAEPFVIEEGEKSYISEQFRHLRTSLAYLGINSRKKKILVTSTIGGEGKSFVAANLALTLALTNKKVVLVELDLRKPKLNKVFNVSREVGITSYFTGDKDADHIIKPTDISKNLFLILAGAIPPNPSELILNGRLEELLSYLETIFDYIIIDSAPTRPVTDAFILSELCDATLYVVRHGVTPKVFIKTLDENNAIHKLKNMAIVFNGVKNRGMGNNYGYGYGYGYGTYDYTEKRKPAKKNKRERRVKNEE